MAKMMMLIDPSRCTGCRGCQVACKQWNEQKAVKTTFTGSYQNPPDMDGDTYNIVRFSEQDNGKDYGVYWLMTHDKCRHCAEPTCVDGFKKPQEAAYIDPHGAVLYTDKATDPISDIVDSCPFNIPRKRDDGLVVKCTLCADRLGEGMEPACAKACPTGAITWGHYDGMMEYAKARIDWLKKHNADRVKADKVRLYPELPSHVKWILIDDLEAHGLEGDA